MSSFQTLTKLRYFHDSSKAASEISSLLASHTSSHCAVSVGAVLPTDTAILSLTHNNHIVLVVHASADGSVERDVRKLSRSLSASPSSLSSLYFTILMLGGARCSNSASSTRDEVYRPLRKLASLMTDAGAHLTPMPEPELDVELDDVESRVSAWASAITKWSEGLNDADNDDDEDDALSVALAARNAGNLQSYHDALKSNVYETTSDAEFVSLYSHHLLPNTDPPTEVEAGVIDVFHKYEYTYESAYSYISFLGIAKDLPTILDANYFHSIRSLLPEPTNEKQALLSIFLFGLTLPSTLLSTLLPPQTLSLLQSSSLLLQSQSSSAHLLSPYQIYPLSSIPFNSIKKPSTVLIATDWGLECMVPPKHAVMPVGQDSLELIAVHSADNLNKQSPNVVDMCCGSGIQGITYYSLTSPESNLTLIDVNPRALKLCRLNLSLNSITDAQTFLGNCWDAVCGEPVKYDRILCNPPFVAVPDLEEGAGVYDQPSFYASGGKKGDEVLKRFLSPLREKLDDKGRCYIVTEVPNVRESPAELAKMINISDGGDVRVNVAYCVEDVETVEDYSRVRSEERGLSSTDAKGYEAGINGDNSTVDRALVLISIGFDDYGANLFAYTSQPPVEPPGDNFLEGKGIQFLRSYVIFEKERTVAEVGEDNANFIEEEKTKAFDGDAEVKALSTIFSDSSIVDVCSRKLGGRWPGVLEKYTSKAWRGEDIRNVVDALDAPHLKPTGMLVRLLTGTDAAAFGVATLLAGLK